MTPEERGLLFARWSDVFDQYFHDVEESTDLPHRMILAVITIQVLTVANHAPEWARAWYEALVEDDSLTDDMVNEVMNLLPIEVNDD